MTYILGLDGASWQGYPAWDQLYAEGRRFMLWKVTGEGNYVNPTARVNLERAYDAGFVTGGYDWAQPENAVALPTGEDAANDYARVLDAIGAWRKGFIPAVDWETPGWATGPLGTNIEEYMRRYFARLYDIATIDKDCQNIGVYTAPYFLAETGGTAWAWLRKYIYWIAAPGQDGKRPDDAAWPDGALVAPWDEAAFHQHSWYETSPAVVGTFDGDRYKDDMARLWALGYQGTPQPTPGGDEVQVPPEGKWSVAIMPNGNTVMVLNFGGQTTPDGLVGAAIVDVGVTVKSLTEPGVTVSRSFKDEAAQQWAEHRPTATAHPLGTPGTVE